MAAAHKKHEASKEEKPASNAVDAKSDLADAKEPIVVSDVVTETTERIEVIEEVSPKEASKAPPVESASSDPLTDFKEKMDKEEYFSSDTPSQKNFMWPILFVVLLALISMAGIFIYKNSSNKTEKINVVTLSPTPTAVPQPTKTIDLAKYEIKILNGSSVDGEAGRQKSNLEEEGFTVSSVGNADNSDFTETIIQAKKEVEQEFLDKLQSVLEATFTLGEIEALPDDATTPIVVILGTKK